MKMIWVVIVVIIGYIVATIVGYKYKEYQINHHQVLPEEVEDYETFRQALTGQIITILINLYHIEHNKLTINGSPVSYTEYLNTLAFDNYLFHINFKWGRAVEFKCTYYGINSTYFLNKNFRIKNGVIDDTKLSTALMHWTNDIYKGEYTKNKGQVIINNFQSLFNKDAIEIKDEEEAYETIMQVMENYYVRKKASKQDISILVKLLSYINYRYKDKLLEYIKTNQDEEVHD